MGEVRRQDCWKFRFGSKGVCNPEAGDQTGASEKERGAQKTLASREVCRHDGSRCERANNTVPQPTKVKRILCKVVPTADQLTNQSTPPDFDSDTLVSSEDSPLPVIGEPSGQKASPQVLKQISQCFARCREHLWFLSTHAQPTWGWDYLDWKVLALTPGDYTVQKYG